MISWKCCYACHFFWRRSSSVCSLCIKVSRRQLPWDVQMFLISFVFCYLREKVPAASPPIPLLPHSLRLFLSIAPSLSLPLSRSLSFALKSNQLVGFLFMSPGSDALASKLCKCILPVKLKPSLLVLRGLLHRVLHHSLGSGPSHFPP